jgi:hypothetical protein
MEVEEEVEDWAPNQPLEEDVLDVWSPNPNQLVDDLQQVS